MLPSSQFTNLNFIQLTKTSTIVPPPLAAAFFPFQSILVLLEPQPENHSDKLFELSTAKFRRKPRPAPGDLKPVAGTVISG
jgi:hypothetical protein